MITAVMMAAVQAAAPVPPAPPAPPKVPVDREIVIREVGDAKGAATAGKDAPRQIFVIREGKGPAAATAADHRIRIVDVEKGKDVDRREIRILRQPGAPGERLAMLSCDKGAGIDSESTDKDGKKTRVMVCAKGGNQVEALERATRRIAENKELPEDVRTRVLGQMNAEIARLKASK